MGRCINQTYNAILILACCALFAFFYLPRGSLLEEQQVFIKSLLGRSESSQRKIPIIVHFILGIRDKKGTEQDFRGATPFSFFNYLVVLAARRHLKPKKLFIHYGEEPNTFWWNQTKISPEIKITLVKARLVEHIFGRPVDHHAHRSDVIRLELLRRYGGIYLDHDVLTLRSFAPLMRLSDVVMAHQDDQNQRACGAVILSKRDAPFIGRWYDAYHSFNQSCWDCHSVSVPGILASLYPNEIRVLPTKTFFRPSWTESRKFFKSNDYQFRSNYATHLWSKMNDHYLRNLTPASVLSMNNTFGRMVRYAIGNGTLLDLQRVMVQ